MRREDRTKIVKGLKGEGERGQGQNICHTFWGIVIWRMMLLRGSLALYVKCVGACRREAE